MNAEYSAVPELFFNDLRIDQTATMTDSDFSRACAVGLLTEEYFDNIDTFTAEAIEAGHNFIVTPIVHPTYSRVLKAGNEWRDNPVYSRDDLVLKAASKWFKIVLLLWGTFSSVFPWDWSDVTVGILSNWLELDAEDQQTRVNSELVIPDQTL